ncbi:MAG: helix-turn-helix transcriptional regulator, partial [Nonomuraea sp.]|nr:helix-turn-helix transcriptional regulator [Nonomuraea sp.]
RGSEQPARPNEDPVAQWLGAVHLNGAGRYAEALEAARRACAHLPGVLALWGPAELVELATRQGRTDLARAAFDQLTEAALAGRTDWGLGMEARARALLGQDPDHHFRAAIARLERTRMRADLARTHLLYGEHLRAEQRRNEAREHLRTALELFAEAGMDGFAARAERELAATGATTRRRGADTAERLTPQEARIAELARTGLTNKEIATRLHVSPRTVEYHLHKVFAKQGVTSRTQLRQP